MGINMVKISAPFFISDIQVVTYLYHPVLFLQSWKQFEVVLGFLVRKLHPDLEIEELQPLSCLQVSRYFKNKNANRIGFKVMCLNSS